MPLATRKNANTPQSAALKPCVRPYHGTRIAAAAKVSANISTLVQTRGAAGSVRVAWDMRGRGSSVGVVSGRSSTGPLNGDPGSGPQEGAVTYHATGVQVGLASILSMLRRLGSGPKTQKGTSVTSFRDFLRVPRLALALAGAWLALAPA